MSEMRTFRVTFEGSGRVERVRAFDYRSVPPWVEFFVEDGHGLEISHRVVARFDGRGIARITTTG